MTKQFLMNTWYVAALSTEVGETMLSRKLLNVPVVLFRKKDGSLVALHDRCPHRFAPLSMGKKVDDQVACPYHGLVFNGEGKCTHNPHGNGHIPNRAQVASYPLLERHGFIWIWMGDQPADASQLPDYSVLDRGHPNGIGHTYMRRPCHYELIIDNVMDLSHVDHLHGEIITTRGQLSPKIPDVQDKGGQVVVRWEWEQAPPMMIFNDFLPEPGNEARHFVQVTWAKPANIQLTVGATQCDGALTYENATAQYDLHVCTPETDSSTHYFFATRRNHNVEDAEYNKVKLDGMHGAFELEDGPILDVVQEAMGTSDFFSLNPILISSDAGPVRVRRLLQSLIAKEQENTAA